MTHLKGVLFLAADTIRSRAYAQAMVHAGYTVDNCIIVRSATGTRWGQASKIKIGNTDFSDMFIPELETELHDSCQLLCDNIDIVEVGSVNAPEVVALLGTYSPDLVVFSGFGGELVHDDVLSAAGPLLHMHAGLLPQYRGSTTIYYSYLQEGNMGVSAIYLSNEIDAGQIIARKTFPAPPRGANVDYYYDSVIRSDLLVSVLSTYEGAGVFAAYVCDDASSGDERTYYIIHPLLKHIALNKLHHN